MSISLDTHRDETSSAIASNLALHEEVARRRERGQSVIHLGFGEARFPVFPGLIRHLAEGAVRSGYAPVAGSLDVRTAVAGYFSRRNIRTSPEQVVMAPGSKPLLFALINALDGDVVLPRPCWVTYPSQVLMSGKIPLSLPVPDGYGGIPEPDQLRHALAKAAREGRRISAVVLTLPDNPTGTLCPAPLVEEVCAISDRHGVTVISDEIYRDTLHDCAPDFVSPAEILDDRVVVTAGLSKSHALGGWRIGTARLPDTRFGRELHQRVLAQASQIWSSLAGPMEAVAAYAYSEPADLQAYVARCTRVHAHVAKALRTIFVDAGAICPQPTGGFYTYPDFELCRDQLSRRGCHGGDQFQELLLDGHGLAVLAGGYFGDPRSALRFRAATSLLYGDDEAELAETLAATDPAGVPHVRDRLAAISSAVTAAVS
jgi:aspartate aminotransferase